MKEHLPVRLAEDNRNLTYSTSYGAFVIEKTRPWFVRLRQLGDDTSATFTARFRNVTLLPGNGSYEVVGSTLWLYYKLYRMPEGTFMGNMSVSLAFHSERNKISAAFTPAPGRAGDDFRIVWIAFTSHKVVVTADPSEREKEIGRLGPLENNSIGDTGRAVIFKPHRGAVRRSVLDFGDARDDWQQTFAGVYQFGGRVGNAAAVVFEPGHLVIDPSLVSSPSSVDAAKYSIQRKTFFDGERYWLFWYDGVIKYTSSSDGLAWSSVATDIPLNPGNLDFSFTVLDIGRLVALVWVGKDGSNANKNLVLVTGQIEGEFLKWSTSSPRVVMDSGVSCSFTEPAIATFTSQGQIAITVIAQCPSSKQVWFTRYTCAGDTCQSGSSPPWTRVDDPNAIRDYTLSMPVAFNGDNGTVAVFYAATDYAFLSFNVYFSGGEWCEGNPIAWQRGPSELKAYFAAAPSGGAVVAFIAFKPLFSQTYYIYGWSVYTSCLALQNAGYYTSGYEPLYLSAGTQTDGMTLNLFWTQATDASAGKRHVFYSWRIPDQAGGSTSVEEAPWAASYEDPVHVSTALLSARFAPLAFATVAPNPNYDYLYFSSYPLPVDSSAAPAYLPWGQSITSPGFAELGGAVNPANGLLFHSVGLVSLPGRAGTDLSLSMIYRQPGLYFRNVTAGTDMAFRYYAAPAFYGRFAPGMHLDLPWLDRGPAIVHLPGGSNFFVVWDHPEQQVRWFNNTRGIRFTLKFDLYVLQDYRYTLTMPSGAFYNLDQSGRITRYFASLDASNLLTYSYDANSNLYQITDAIGRKASITRDGNGRITQLAYGAERVMMSYAAGCSGTNSEIMTLTDVLGRKTIYTVCNYLMTKVEFPTGGRVVYSYAVYGTSQVNQGTDVYGLPLLQSDDYNESAVSRKTRTTTFSYKTRNGEVLEADLRFYDGFGAFQGTKEFRYQLSAGTVSTRILDASGQVLHFDMQTLLGAQMKDLSGNGNHGTMSGAVDIDGRWGRARDFDGTASYMEVADSPTLSSTTAITVSLWFRHRYTSFPLNDVKGLFYKGANTGWGQRNYEGSLQTDGRVEISWLNTGTSDILVGNRVLTDNNWHHLVAVFDWQRDSASLYIDGALDNSKASTVDPSITTAKLVLGKVSETSPANRFFNGRIDELRVYGKALTANEQNSLMVHNAIQRGMDQNWYSVNDQPHLVETFAGEETDPSAVTQDFADDWGNPIYSRDASGNETFRSFGNTNHGGQFYAPGSLKRTTDGRLYASGFDLYEQDWSVVGGSPVLSFDDTTYRQYPPSLNVTSSVGTHQIERAFTPTPVVLVDLNLRLSSDAKLLSLYIRNPTEARGEIQFASDHHVKLLDSSGSYYDCVWPPDVGGGVVTYVANLWYRLTVTADINSGGTGGHGGYSVSLDGMDICSVTMPGTAGSTVDRIRIAVTDSLAAWLDDVRVSKGVAISLSGLAVGERAYLYSADRTEIIDLQRISVAGTTLQLTLNPSSLTKFYPNGLAVLRVFGADSTLQYDSPFKRFFGGDGYAYTHPKVLDDLLVRTRSGFGTWTPPLLVDDHPSPGTPYGFQWSTFPSVSGTEVHVSPFAGYGSIIQEHGYYNGPPWLVASGTFLVQYVYISGQPPVVPTTAPAQVVLKFGDDVDGPPINWLGKASWGMAIDPSITKNMGWMPSVRDGWIQLVVKADDIGVANNYVNSRGYEIVGGSALWDASALADSTLGSLKVTGLSKISGYDRGIGVDVYWANNDTFIAGSTSAPYADSVSVSLYPRITAFPAFVRLVFRDYDGFIRKLPAPRSVWGGDIFNYVGDTGFYDPGSLSYQPSNIHTSPVGSKVYLGDCLDAVLCYDMQSRVEDFNIAAGTGAISRTMLDLSGRGNSGSIVGTALVEVPSSAAGLATNFNGNGDYINVADNVSLRPTFGITVSAWFRPNTFAPAGIQRGIVEKYLGGGTAYGYLLSIDGDFNNKIGWTVAQLAGVKRTIHSDSSVVLGTWVHAVAIATVGGNIELYVNGIKQAEVLSLNGITHSLLSMMVGSWGPYYFDGAIDQVIVYDRALTASEALARYHTRMPGASASFAKSDAAGHILEMRTAYEGRYLVSKIAYDSYGNVATAWDLGSGTAGANTTQYFYSSSYGGAYPTRIVRPDGKESLTSFDRNLGVKLGTLSPDCKVGRTDYDAAGRPASTSQYDSDPSAKLILDMEMPDGSNLKDLSCNGNPATISGPIEVNGVSGKARDFNGSTDYLQVTDSNSISMVSSFTISAWIQADTLATPTRTIVSKIQSPYGFQFYISPDSDPTYARRLRLDLGSGSALTSFASSTQVAVGTWYHVAVVFDDPGNTVMFYVDGFAAGCTGSCSYTGQLSDLSQPLRVGAKADANVNNFDGRIDEVYLFNRPLSATEIGGLARFTFKLLARTYAAFDDMVATDGSPWAGYQFHGVTTYDAVSAPRALYYDMETKRVTIGATNYLEDLSGNGNHGKPTGAYFVATGGKLGGYYNFNPGDGEDNIRVSSDGTKLNFTLEFTIAAWFKLTDVNNRWGVSKFNSGTCTGSSYAMMPAYGYSTGKPNFVICGGGVSDSVQGSTSLATGSWKFVAATFDRGVLKLYIDGSLGSPVTKTSTIKRVQTGTARLTIGADSSVGGTAMNGGIDEVHIFPRALTTAEVQTLYDSYATPSAPTEKSHMAKHYFDGLGRETRSVARDMFGNRIETKVDLSWNDNPQRSYHPSGWYDTFVYDFEGRTVSATSPGDSVTLGTSSTRYLEKDRKVESLDALGRKAYQKMDLLGRVIEGGVWNPATVSYGNLTKTAYNALGLVTRSEDAKQQVSTSYYNMLGLVRLTIDPTGKASIVTYDDNQREVSRTDVMGRVLITAYDSNSRVKTLTLKPSAGSGTTYVTTYGYDAADNLASIKNGTSSIYRLFDVLHRLKTEYFAMPASCPQACISNLSVSYDYDAASRVTNLTYQDGATKAAYTYDSLSRPIQVAFGTTPTKQATLVYDAAGRVDFIHYYMDGTDIGIYEDYAYDVRERVTNIRVYKATTDHLNLTYSYDRASEIVHIDDNANTGAGTKAHDYAYDGNGLVARATGPWGAGEGPVVMTYQYDAVGNVLSKTDGGVPTTYTYTSWNLLTNFGSTAFTYNDAGSPLNRTPSSGPKTNYTYDFTQRLVKVAVSQDSHMYDYDGGGRRIKTAEIVSQVTTTRYFVYSGGQSLGYKEGSTNTFFVYLAGKLLFRKTGTAENRYYFQDVSDNVRLVVYYTSSVQTEGKFRYKPYGEIVVLTDSVAPVFKYAQQQLDQSGMYHMGARDYDPAIGRFLSRDPIGSGYSYGADNPLSFGDPSGLTPRQRFQNGIAFLPDLWNLKEGLLAKYDSSPHFNSRGLPGDEPPWYEPIVDWWQSLPFEWQFVVSIAIMIGLALLTAVTFGAGAEAMFAMYTVFAAGVAFGVAVVEYGVATGHITNRDQAMDIFFTVSMAGELAIPAGILAYRGAMWIGRGLARLAQEGSEALIDAALGGRPLFRIAGEASESEGGLLRGAPTKGRVAVIGEGMERVRPFASNLGAEVMPNVPPGNRLAANRVWINRLMDEGYTIVDIGPTSLTSKYYIMELYEVSARNYPRYLPLWGVVG